MSAHSRRNCDQLNTIDENSTGSNDSQLEENDSEVNENDYISIHQGVTATKSNVPVCDGDLFQKCLNQQINSEQTKEEIFESDVMKRFYKDTLKLCFRKMYTDSNVRDWNQCIIDSIYNRTLQFIQLFVKRIDDNIEELYEILEIVLNAKSTFNYIYDRKQQHLLVDGKYRRTETRPNQKQNQKKKRNDTIHTEYCLKENICIETTFGYGTPMASLKSSGWIRDYLNQIHRFDGFVKMKENLEKLKEEEKLSIKICTLTLKPVVSCFPILRDDFQTFIYDNFTVIVIDLLENLKQADIKSNADAFRTVTITTGYYMDTPKRFCPFSSLFSTLHTLMKYHETDQNVLEKYLDFLRLHIILLFIPYAKYDQKRLLIEEIIDMIKTYSKSSINDSCSLGFAGRMKKVSKTFPDEIELIEQRLIDERIENNYNNNNSYSFRRFKRMDSDDFSAAYSDVIERGIREFHNMKMTNGNVMKTPKSEKVEEESNSKGIWWYYTLYALNNNNRKISIMMANFMKRYDLFRHIFANSLHQKEYCETISQIISFLLSNNCLDDSEIDSLIAFDDQVKQHDIMQENIHEMLITVSKAMSMDHLSYIFRRLSNKDSYELANERQQLKYINLISEIGQNITEPDGVINVLNILSSLALNSSTSLTIAETAFGRYSRLLSMKNELIDNETYDEWFNQLFKEMSSKSVDHHYILWYQHYQMFDYYGLNSSSFHKIGSSYNNNNHNNSNHHNHNNNHHHHRSYSNDNTHNNDNIPILPENNPNVSNPMIEGGSGCSSPANSDNMANLQSFFDENSKENLHSTDNKAVIPLSYKSKADTRESSPKTSLCTPIRRSSATLNSSSNQQLKLLQKYDVGERLLESLKLLINSNPEVFEDNRFSLQARTSIIYSMISLYDYVISQGRMEKKRKLTRSTNINLNKNINVVNSDDEEDVLHQTEDELNQLDDMGDQMNKKIKEDFDLLTKRNDGSATPESNDNNHFYHNDYLNRIYDLVMVPNNVSDEIIEETYRLFYSICFICALYRTEYYEEQLNLYQFLETRILPRRTFRDVDLSVSAIYFYEIVFYLINKKEGNIQFTLTSSMSTGGGSLRTENWMDHIATKSFTKHTNIYMIDCSLAYSDFLWNLLTYPRLDENTTNVIIEIVKMMMMLDIKSNYVIIGHQKRNEIILDQIKNCLNEAIQKKEKEVIERILKLFNFFIDCYNAKHRKILHPMNMLSTVQSGRIVYLHVMLIVHRKSDWNRTYNYPIQYVFRVNEGTSLETVKQYIIEHSPMRTLEVLFSRKNKKFKEDAMKEIGDLENIAKKEEIIYENQENIFNHFFSCHLNKNDEISSKQKEMLIRTASDNYESILKENVMYHFMWANHEVCRSQTVELPSKFRYEFLKKRSRICTFSVVTRSDEMKEVSLCYQEPIQELLTSEELNVTTSKSIQHDLEVKLKDPAFSVCVDLANQTENETEVKFEECEKKYDTFFPFVTMDQYDDITQPQHIMLVANLTNVERSSYYFKDFQITDSGEVKNGEEIEEEDHRSNDNWHNKWPCTSGPIKLRLTNEKKKSIIDGMIQEDYYEESTGLISTYFNESTPLYIISQNTEFYNSLLQICDEYPNDQLDQSSWKLIISLYFDMYRLWKTPNSISSNQIFEGEMTAEKCYNFFLLFQCCMKNVEMMNEFFNNDGITILLSALNKTMNEVMKSTNLTLAMFFFQTSQFLQILINYKRFVRLLDGKEDGKMKLKKLNELKIDDKLYSIGSRKFIANHLDEINNESLSLNLNEWKLENELSIIFHRLSCSCYDEKNHKSHEEFLMKLREYFCLSTLQKNNMIPLDRDELSKYFIPLQNTLENDNSIESHFLHSQEQYSIHLMNNILSLLSIDIDWKYEKIERLFIQNNYLSNLMNSTTNPNLREKLLKFFIDIDKNSPGIFEKLTFNWIIDQFDKEENSLEYNEFLIYLLNRKQFDDNCEEKTRALFLKMCEKFQNFFQLINERIGNGKVDEDEIKFIRYQSILSKLKMISVLIKNGYLMLTKNQIEESFNYLLKFFLFPSYDVLRMHAQKKDADIEEPLIPLIKMWNGYEIPKITNGKIIPLVFYNNEDIDMKLLELFPSDVALSVKKQLISTKIFSDDNEICKLLSDAVYSIFTSIIQMKKNNDVDYILHELLTFVFALHSNSEFHQQHCRLLERERLTEILNPFQYLNLDDQQLKESSSLHKELLNDIWFRNFTKNQSPIPMNGVKFAIDKEPPSSNYIIRNAPGYVGLLNCGATCYMNAVFQQLYMIKALREAVQSINFDLFLRKNGIVPKNWDFSAISRENLQTNVSTITRMYCGDVLEVVKKLSDEEYDMEDMGFRERVYQIGVIKHVQDIFVNLSDDRITYYTPTAFLNYFRLNDDPININQQHDAQEFFSCILDTLDEGFKALKLPSPIECLIGGTYEDQKICHTCPHRYSRTEPFSIVNVEVTSCTTLEESLQQYVKGDLLEGSNRYHCEKCEKKVDALKRTCFGTVRPFFIIQLKRFNYDWTKNLAIKNNEYFEFPRELNIHPFTTDGMKTPEENDEQLTDDVQMKENEIDINIEMENEELDELEKKKKLEDSTYSYRLSGVVVHSGRAQGGHYYSFIKSDNDKWHRYDDSSVRELEFDDEALDAHCFGGSNKNNDHNYHAVHLRSENRFWNAYLLIYRKIENDSNEMNERKTMCKNVIQSTLLERYEQFDKRILIPSLFMDEESKLKFIRNCLDAIATGTQLIDDGLKKELCLKHLSSSFYDIHYEHSYMLFVNNLLKETVKISSSLPVSTLLNIFIYCLYSQFTIFNQKNAVILDQVDTIVDHYDPSKQEHYIIMESITDSLAHLIRIHPEITRTFCKYMFPSRGVSMLTRLMGGAFYYPLCRYLVRYVHGKLTRIYDPKINTMTFKLVIAALNASKKMMVSTQDFSRLVTISDRIMNAILTLFETRLNDSERVFERLKMIEGIDLMNDDRLLDGCLTRIAVINRKMTENFHRNIYIYLTQSTDNLKQLINLFYFERIIQINAFNDNRRIDDTHFSFYEALTLMTMMRSGIVEGYSNFHLEHNPFVLNLEEDKFELTEKKHIKTISPICHDNSSDDEMSTSYFKEQHSHARLCGYLVTSVHNNESKDNLHQSEIEAFIQFACFNSDSRTQEIINTINGLFEKDSNDVLVERYLSIFHRLLSIEDDLLEKRLLCIAIGYPKLNGLIKIIDDIKFSSTKIRIFDWLCHLYEKVPMASFITFRRNLPAIERDTPNYFEFENDRRCQSSTMVSSLFHVNDAVVNTAEIVVKGMVKRLRNILKKDGERSYNWRCENATFQSKNYQLLLERAEKVLPLYLGESYGDRD
ncbi:hypothetical protein SNEBB_005645 [Seison nebaliae]|nr:hypothetical protein SNEBB_005645 [Seison nebaliae]